MEVLRMNNVSKTYGKTTVLNDVNMHINEGEIFGLIGRNGAGKTTIMKMIIGMTEITSGSIKLWNKPVDRKNSSTYSRMGISLDFQGFYPELTAYENLKVFANIRGITRKDAIECALEQVGLLTNRNKKYKKFSLGIKKRLALANAIIHEPEFMALDEPTNGLDPIGIAEFREYLMRISKKKNITIMISSHLLSEIDIMADRIGILDQGRIIVEKSMAEIRKSNSTYISLKTTNIALTCGILEKRFSIKQYEVMEGNAIHIYNMKINKETLSKTLAAHGIGILEITENKKELEEYFSDLVR